MLVKMYFDMITLTDFLVSAQSDAQSVKNFLFIPAVSKRKNLPFQNDHSKTIYYNYY